MTVAYPITAVPANKVTVVVSTCLLIMASLAVGLRMWARYLGSIGLGSDDYLILFSLVYAFRKSIMPLLYMAYGMGRHMSDLSAENVQIILKLTIAYQIIYGTTLAAIKLSYMTFYCRVFRIRADFMRWAYGLIAVIISWWIGNTLQALLICRPFVKSWIPTTPGQCGNSILAYAMVAIFNIATDVAMLLLPMPYIGSLQMQKKKKYVLILMFGVGLL
ncbi:hypothetical protein BDV97DRAFT_298975 [Delphinella strobiligena]|nr:hypothetical protein BDV97DRAFT_298975 [Delphinella strobiligena]